LASTKRLATSETGQAWRDAGLPYYSCNFFLRQRFGRRVQKVSIDAGFTCPNVDGRAALISWGGTQFEYLMP
jgi:radical SAM superfamily enzyme